MFSLFAFVFALVLIYGTNHNCWTSIAKYSAIKKNIMLLDNVVFSVDIFTGSNIF